MSAEQTRLNSVLLGGPLDGRRCSVEFGVDWLPVVDRRNLRVHVYEFDPVTDRSGRWIYRYRGELPQERRRAV